MMTLATVADELYKCAHEAPDGTSAFINIGAEDEGYEQCILCGKVICTEEEEPVPARYGL